MCQAGYSIVGSDAGIRNLKYALYPSLHQTLDLYRQFIKLNVTWRCAESIVLGAEIPEFRTAPKSVAMQQLVVYLWIGVIGKRGAGNCTGHIFSPSLNLGPKSNIAPE